MRSFRPQSISSSYLLTFILLCVTFLIIFGFIWIGKEYDGFNSKSKILKSEFINKQKIELQRQTRICYDFIEFKKAQTEDRLRELLKDQVTQAHTIATNIYNIHKGKLSSREIKSRIKEALSPIRFNNNRGYVFINSIKGKGIMYPYTPSHEGKDLSNLKDINGHCVVMTEIDLIKRQKEGFIAYPSTDNVPNKKNIYSKISFVKIFEPYGWYMGSKAYTDDFQDQIKKETLQRLNSIQSNTNDYIFIYQQNGVCIKHKKNQSIGIKYEEESNALLKNSVEQILSLAQKNDSAFMENYITDIHKGPKISHIRKINDWNWIIGATFHTNTIDKHIEQIHNNLKKRVTQYILEIILLIILAIIILYFTAQMIARKMQQSFDSLQTFVREAAYRSDKINPEKLHFNEFRYLAKSVNHMLDIRTHKELQLQNARNKAEESDRLKSAFLSNMSHEIRTPLNAIIGFSQLLQQQEINKENQQQYLNLIQSSGSNLLNLINDIIDISKIEAKELSTESTPCHLNKLINEILDFFKQEQIRKGKTNILLTSQLGLSNQQAQIIIDPFRLRQILTNLMDNALKFTHKGQIQIGYYLQNDQMLQFYIKDTGIGIPEKKQKVIFNRFRQADDSHTREYGGTGLGLTISQRLTKIMGGTMWVESTPQKGSSFFFTIPYTYNPSEELETEKKLDSSLLKGKRILLVDDHKPNLTILKEMLMITKMELFMARNGSEAIKINRENHMDLILLDLQMPVMNGYEVLKQIKKENPQIKIVAQTAYALAQEKEEILARGFDDYIAKPIIQKDLLEIITRILN